MADWPVTRSKWADSTWSTSSPKGTQSGSGKSACLAASTTGRSSSGSWPRRQQSGCLRGPGSWRRSRSRGRLVESNLKGGRTSSASSRTRSKASMSASPRWPPLKTRNAPDCEMTSHWWSDHTIIVSLQKIHRSFKMLDCSQLQSIFMLNGNSWSIAKLNTWGKGPAMWPIAV